MDWQAILAFLVRYRVAIIILFFLLLWLYLRIRAKKRAEADAEPMAAADAGPEREKTKSLAKPARRLKSSFRIGVRRLGRYFQGRKGRYRLPWYLMMGPVDAGKTTLLGHSGLKSPSGEQAQPVTGEPCRWWFFEGGIVLDLDGHLLSLDDPNDDGEWRELARLLLRHRRRRPFDGVLLTVPAGELAGLDQGGEADLETRAEVLYRRLVTLQRTTGMVFPVYVLITHSDRIEGFDAFCEEIPDLFEDQCFGWSATQDLKEPYHEGWVDTALQTLVRRLRELQLEAAYNGISPDVREAFFRFPQELAALARPLRIFMNGIFTQTAFHDPIPLRGIYFCSKGRVSGPPESVPDEMEAPETDPFPDEVEIEERSAPATASRSRFFAELLTKKAFPEYPIARPSRSKLSHSKNKVLALQTGLALFALVTALGLFFSIRGLGRHNEHLETELSSVYRDLKTLSGFAKPPTSVDAEQSQGKEFPKGEDALKMKNTDRLFSAMTAFETRPNYSLFLPGSWPLFSSLKKRTEDAIGYSYEQIVLHALHLRLSQKKRLLLEGPTTQEPSFNIYRNTPYEEMTTYLTLVEWLDEISRLHHFIEIHDNLETHFQVNDFDELVRYVFDYRGERATLYRRDYYREALENFRTVEFNKQDRELAVAKTQYYYEHLLAEVFHVDLVVSRNQEFMAQSINLQYDWLLDVPTAFAEIQNLTEILGETRQALPSTFSLQSEENREKFENVLAPLRKADFLGADLDDSLYAHYREHLLYYSQMLNPEFLNGAFRFIRPFQEFSTLQTFLEDSHEVGPRKDFAAWHLLDLDNSVNLYRNFKQHYDNELANLPKGYWLPVMVNLAVLSFDQQAKRVIRRVPALADNERLEGQVQDFLAAKPSIDRMLGILGELELDATARLMVKAVEERALGLLELIDQRLLGSSFFKPDLSKWYGEFSIPEVLLGIRDEKGMEGTFRVNLERIRALARIADDLLDVVEDREPGEPHHLVLTRWRRILEDFEDYDGLQPYPVIRRLERFIVDDLPRVNLGNYEALTAGFRTDLSDSAEDTRVYFENTYQRLKRDVYERCRTLERGRRESDLLRMQRTFNREVGDFFTSRLQGRFPFAAPDLPASNPAATPADIRTLYRRFRAIPDGLVSHLEALPNPDPDQRHILGLIRHLTDWEAFFAPLNDPPPLQADASWRIRVDLRVHRDHERNGNQIMERGLTLGGSRPLAGGAEAFWRFGEPIALQLRWAKDSPSLPEPGSKPWFVSDGSVVSFRFEEPWALARLFSLHRRSMEGRAAVLGFRIPMISNPELPQTVAPATLPEDTAVFLKLELQDENGNPQPLPILNDWDSLYTRDTPAGPHGGPR